ncbi:hypothetical protein IJX73_02515 [bacterium]|nr:hypothetical protein [bacterium]
MSKVKLVLLITMSLISLVAFGHESANGRDYLYSEEYFDYLIECANEKAIEQQQEQKEQIEELVENSEITAFEFQDGELGEIEPFKLKVESFNNIAAYKETFYKEDSKAIIPVGNKFSFIQDTTKFRNKYNSDDYRVLAGAEYTPFKFFQISSGVETNYRGYDQNPTSRKLYITPTLKFNDKISLSFYNKVNVQTNSTDHDVSLNISPFKSKAVDFKIYAGITKYEAGTHSESINFYTNFYFF